MIVSVIVKVVQVKNSTILILLMESHGNEPNRKKRKHKF